MKTIAVWGTLRKGRGNNWLLENQKFVGVDKAIGVLCDTYYLSTELTNRKEDMSEVEVYEISEECYNHLNEFENRFGFYSRDIELESGSSARIWLSGVVDN